LDGEQETKSACHDNGSQVEVQRDNAKRSGSTDRGANDTPCGYDARETTSLNQQKLLLVSENQPLRISFESMP